MESAKEALKNERSLKDQAEKKLLDEQQQHANLHKECEMLKGKLLDSLLEQEKLRKSLDGSAKDEELTKLRHELIEARTRIKCLEEAEKDKKVCNFESFAMSKSMIDDLIGIHCPALISGNAICNCSNDMVI